MKADSASMPAGRSSSIQGYAEDADQLIQAYDSIDFADLHRDLIPLLPAPPTDIVDIGAGTGRDAVGFASLGYRVVAVEPVAAFRSHGAKAYPTAAIEWIDDTLPDLPRLSGRAPFQVVTLTAVLMHLDAGERRRAIARLSMLLGGGGLVSLSLRHGPVPAGRRMFDVSSTETIAVAEDFGLTPIICLEGLAPALKSPGVTWDRLIFRRN